MCPLPFSSGFLSGQPVLFPKIPMPLPSLPHFPSPWTGMEVERDLRWVQGPVAAVAAGDGEHCPKVRSDEVQDGSSCGAKQR